MMLEWSYLVGPLVGGVIGYITNDVAIRMLFRPHQPKYLFGVHIPLTPGIIPKERYRIAEAVGQTISENLMNQEVLERTLLSPELIGRIAGAIDRFAAAQRTNDETLEQFIRHYLTRQELESMRGQVETDLTKMLYKKLSDESVGTKISHKIMEKVLEKMQSGMAGVVGSTLGLNQMAELVAEPAEHLMAKHINELISQHSEQMVSHLLKSESEKLMQVPMCQLMEDREHHHRAVAAHPECPQHQQDDREPHQRDGHERHRAHRTPGDGQGTEGGHLVRSAAGMSHWNY